jgi:hypothetical protein
MAQSTVVNDNPIRRIMAAGNYYYAHRNSDGSWTVWAPDKSIITRLAHTWDSACGIAYAHSTVTR